MVSRVRRHPPVPPGTEPGIWQREEQETPPPTTAWIADWIPTLASIATSHIPHFLGVFAQTCRFTAAAREPQPLSKCLIRPRSGGKNHPTTANKPFPRSSAFGTEVSLRRSTQELPEPMKRGMHCNRLIPKTIRVPRPSNVLRPSY
jgi:hypothetical protein